MKTIAIRCALGAAAITMLLQASSPANALLWGLTADSDCQHDWPTWKKIADPPAYALWRATCLDTSGTGTPSEDLGPPPKPGTKNTKGPTYQSDPKNGFGDTIPVTLPPDRHPNPHPGTITGIAIQSGPMRVIPPVSYFRPR